MMQAFLYILSFRFSKWHWNIS